MRPLVGILKSVASKLKLEFSTVSDGWVCMLRNGEGKQVVICGCSFPLNGQSCANTALDKASASAVFEHHKVPHIPHKILYGPSYKYSMGSPERLEKGTMGVLYQELAKWLPHGLVLKPKDGNSGRGLVLVRNRLELEAGYLDLLSKARDFVYSPFFPLGNEYRLIILDGELHFCYKKTRAGTEWRHNISLGAQASLVEDDQFIAKALLPVALQAMNSIGLRFASVDLVELQDRTDQKYAQYASADGVLVMEINSAVFMDGFLKQFPDQRPKCLDMYELAIQKSFALSK